MRRFVVAAASAAGLFVTSPSSAADLPARMPVKAAPVIAATPAWSGVYVGLFAGSGWGRAEASAPFDAGSGFFYNFGGASYRFDTKGFFGGGTLGYNVQSGAVVYGLEGEVGYLGLKGSAIEPNDLPASTDTVTRFKSDLYGAIYGRLGVANGNVLFYGKGGLAFLNAKASTIDPCAGTQGCGTTTLSMTGDKLMVGWSAGAGVEWMVGSGWSVKAEYAYFDFGKLDAAGASSVPGEFYRQSVDVTAHTAKLGLNYRFGAPVVARY